MFAVCLGKCVPAASTVCNPYNGTITHRRRMLCLNLHLRKCSVLRRIHSRLHCILTVFIIPLLLAIVARLPVVSAAEEASQCTTLVSSYSRVVPLPLCPIHPNIRVDGQRGCFTASVTRTQPFSLCPNLSSEHRSDFAKLRRISSATIFDNRSLCPSPFSAHRKARTTASLRISST